MTNSESWQKEGRVPRPAPQTTQQEIVGTWSDWNTMQVEAPAQAQLIVGAISIAVNVISSKAARAASLKPFCVMYYISVPFKLILHSVYVCTFG